MSKIQKVRTLTATHNFYFCPRSSSCESSTEIIIGVVPTSSETMPQAAPAKHYCFTLNEIEEGKSAKELVEEIHQAFDAEYTIGGLEKAPTTGHLHLQGYLALKTKKRITALIKIKQMHFIVARGSPEENKKYCSKEGDWFEAGEIPVQERGKRNDMKKIHQMVWVEGKTVAEVAAMPGSHQGLRYAQTLSELRPPPRRTEPPQVIWAHGPTGSGKSRWAFHGHEGAYVAPGTKWFNGYQAHEIVIFDDFRAGDMPFNLLLRLLDRYPMQVETKGGFTHWCPKKIIITTSLPPDLAYGGVPQEDMRQLVRRITEVKAFPLSEEEEAALVLQEVKTLKNR